MRQPTYLSPTSVSKFYKDRDEFYLSYLADTRPPRQPQTRPMSVGSAFDAYIKSYLYEKLHGSVTEEFEREKIFIDQVEEQNRDWAREAGQHVFNAYQKSGAIADLMVELQQAAEQPQFEFTVEGQMKAHSRYVGHVPLLGKPDVYFRTKHGTPVIYDWKVNGYCSKSSVSPKPGFKIIRDGWDSSIAKASRGAYSAHKDFHGQMIDGIMVNIGMSFDRVDSSWADQLCVYSWLLGVEVGEPMLVGIEQICCKPFGAGTAELGHEPPLQRIASHRGRIDADYQDDLCERISHVWATIAGGAEAIFADTMTAEESVAHCLHLDDFYKAFEIKGKHDQWYNDMERQHRGW